MLERGDLWIGPWEPAPGGVPRPWRRLIRSPADDAPLGAVRYMSPWPPPRRPWQPSTVLELVETGDQALVLTLRRSWLFGSRWAVRDAEGSFVGHISGDSLLDPQGRRFASRHARAEGGWTLEEVSGRVYARLLPETAGGEGLAFAEPVVTNPFLRMLILGSFLLLRPHPPAPENTSEP